METSIVHLADLMIAIGVRVATLEIGFDGKEEHQEHSHREPHKICDESNKNLPRAALAQQRRHRGSQGRAFQGSPRDT